MRFGDVDFQHLYLDDLAGFHHLARILDEAVRQRRDVHQAVLVHADVDEGAEVGDVGDRRLRGPCPACRSAISLTPSLKVAALNAGRGSRPGFSSSPRMSVTVGTPNLSLTNSAASALRSIVPLPISALMSPPVAVDDPPHHRVGSGCTAEASSGSSPSADAQEAGALLEGLGAEPRHLLQRLARAGTGRWRRGAATMFCARPVADAGHAREQRRGGGVDVDADAFTQSSTTASSERASLVSATSCWYWPTPIDFGSILTSSASGSCRRRAIETAPRSETSSSGSSFEANAEAE